MLRDYKHQGDDFQEFNENEPKEINIVIEHEERVDVPLVCLFYYRFFPCFFFIYRFSYSLNHHFFSFFF